MLHYKPDLHNAISAYLALVPDFLLDVVGFIGRAIHYINPELYEEVDGMAYNAEVDTGTMMFMQYVYEFTAFCSSSIIRLPDGTIAHDRNLDFAFAPLMRKITFVGQLYHGD